MMINMKKFITYIWSILSLIVIFVSLFKNINGYLISLYFIIGACGLLLIFINKRRNRMILALGSILIAFQLISFIF